MEKAASVVMDALGDLVLKVREDVLDGTCCCLSIAAAVLLLT